MEAAVKVYVEPMAAAQACLTGSAQLEPDEGEDVDVAEAEAEEYAVAEVGAPYEEAVLDQSAIELAYRNF